MHLSSLTIENFRSINSLTWEPKPGLNVVVGENGIGKSNIFLALSKALTSLITNSPNFDALDQRLGNVQTAISVGCRFELDSRTADELLKSLVVNRIEPDKAAEALKRLQLLGNTLEVTSEWSALRWEKSVRLGPLYIQGDSAGAQLPISGQAEEWPEFLKRLANTYPSDAKLQSLLRTSPTVHLLRGLEQGVGSTLNSRFRWIPEHRFRPLSSGQGGNMEVVTGQETATVLFNLKNGSSENQRRYETIQTEFNKLVPTLTIDATQPQAGGNVDVRFTDKATGFEFMLANASAGVGAILAWVTTIVAREDFVIVIENPELHLHPHGQRALYRLISDSASRNQIIVVTHSPIFVDPTKLDCLVRTYHDKNGTHISPMAQDLSPHQKAAIVETLREASNREVLFARAVLLVEGETEEAFLPTVAPRVGRDLDSASVSVLSAGGEGGYGPYIRLLESLGIPFRCLRDKGPGGSAAEYQKFFTFLGTEFEDFMRERGFQQLFKEAKKASGTSKVREGRYLGTYIDPKAVPELFTKLLDEVISAASLSVT